MGKPSLLWQIVLVALNLLVFLGIIQVWWDDSGTPPPGPSQKTESTLVDLPRRDSQPQTAYQVVAAKNLFSVHRRATVKTGNEPTQKNDFDKNILQGIIVVGRERAALVIFQRCFPRNKVEIVRPGETWNGYKVLEIGPDIVTFQAKEGAENHGFPRAQSQSRNCHEDRIMPGKLTP